MILKWLYQLRETGLAACIICPLVTAGTAYLNYQAWRVWFAHSANYPYYVPCGLLLATILYLGFGVRCTMNTDSIKGFIGLCVIGFLGCLMVIFTGVNSYMSSGNSAVQRENSIELVACGIGLVVIAQAVVVVIIHKATYQTLRASR